MRSSNMLFAPLALPFLLAFFLFVGLVIALIQVGIFEYVYEKIGIQRQYIFTLLLLSLLGSYINIPVVEMPAERVISGQEIPFFGMRYVIPFVEEWPRTVIAVNVGGAVIPTLLSLYLLMKNELYGRGLLGIAIVTVIAHWMAQPVEGVGIAIPVFIPPLIAAGTGLVLSRQNAPALAYIAGSLGTLIGADLMNLDQLYGLGAPVVSIGGAGTFDGVFLTGVLAVLLA